ncbi:dienelactone hydrolase family protein [Brevibacterium samyangense]|uniref:Dienelactone hydrolase family protein n=1 Tax=Brevibacterium samyangense TaxID=366888 RepID=A0ABN2TE90_9MICO
MARIVLFHSALGLNEGFRAMARVLEDAGHTVHTPDYYDGHVFTDTDSGIAYRDSVGFGNLAKHAAELIADLPGPLVFGGFSLGAAMAQSMGRRDPRAAAAFLFHAGGTDKDVTWPAHVPLQIHHMVDDPWIDAGAPERLVTCAARGGALAEHFVYPGSGHLFADPTSTDFDSRLATAMWFRVVTALQ